MVSINSTYILACELEFALRKGVSMRSALKSFRTHRYLGNDLRLIQSLIQLQQNFEAGMTSDSLLQIQTVYRRQLFELIELSLSGQPILSHLTQIKNEIRRQCDLDLEAHTTLLPLKILAPLLLLQFPALLIVIIGPWLKVFLKELK